MGATIQSIIDRIVAVTQDHGYVRWPLPELIRWLNDAQGQIAQLHPRAAADYKVLKLAEGSRQDLRRIDPTKNWVRIFEIVCTMVDGEPTGIPCRQVYRQTLDTSNPRWRSRAATALAPEEFALDERNPYVFDVNPPVADGVEVYALVVVKPKRIGTLNAAGTALLDPNERFGLPDGYDIAAIDYVLWRCFSKDANDPSYQQRALTHLQSFQLVVGVELTDAAPTA